MIDSLPRCDNCNSPVTDSVEVEIENHGRTKFGKYVDGSWICNDCLSESATEERLFDTSTNNSVHHEHFGAANKSDVSPNTPPADEADV